MRIRIAMAQMHVAGGDPEVNLTRAETMIARAGKENCSAVVLPECLDLGWTHSEATTQAEAIPGLRSERLSAAARDAGVYVAAGLTEACDDKVYNSAVLLSPKGELLGVHRKINELDFACALYSTGGKLEVFETELGRIGMFICADGRVLEYGRAMAAMGAQFVLSPCSWAVKPGFDPIATPYRDWDDSYTQVAGETRMPIVGVSNVGPVNAGPWKDYDCIGCSLAVDGNGQVLHRSAYGVDAETLDVIEIETRD